MSEKSYGETSKGYAGGNGSAIIPLKTNGGRIVVVGPDGKEYEVALPAGSPGDYPTERRKRISKKPSEGGGLKVKVVNSTGDRDEGLVKIVEEQ